MEKLPGREGGLPNHAHFEPKPLALLQTGDDLEEIAGLGSAPTEEGVELPRGGEGRAGPNMRIKLLGDFPVRSIATDEGAIATIDVSLWSR